MLPASVAWLGFVAICFKTAFSGTQESKHIKHAGLQARRHAGGHADPASMHPHACLLHACTASLADWGKKAKQRKKGQSPHSQSTAADRRQARLHKPQCEVGRSAAFDGLIWVGLVWVGLGVVRLVWIAVVGLMGLVGCFT